MSDAVTTTTDGDVAVIRLDDGKANALSFDVLAGLSAALDAAASGSKAAVLVGRDGKFSAGFDLSVMTGDSVEDAANLLQAGALLGLQVFESPIPVVFGVTGHALAMGGILLTCADYRVGAEGPYKIGLNEVAIGMAVPSFAVELCRDRLVKSWFTRCVQHAHICSPAEALAASFLDEVVPLDQVGRAGDRGRARSWRRPVHPMPFQVTRKLMRGTLADELRIGVERDLKLLNLTRSPCSFVSPAVGRPRRSEVAKPPERRDRSVKLVAGTLRRACRRRCRRCGRRGGRRRPSARSIRALVAGPRGSRGTAGRPSTRPRSSPPQVAIHSGLDTGVMLDGGGASVPESQ